jgi:DNA-binding phage protein
MEVRLRASPSKFQARAALTANFARRLARDRDFWEPPAMPETGPAEADQSAIAAAIKEQLALKRMSRASLAAKARISVSSLEKSLSGGRRMTFAMIVRIEEALGIVLRAAPAAVAPEPLGGYARAAVGFLEGRYLTIRPSFTGGAGLYAYFTGIAWDEQTNRLVFRESGRVDSEFTQFGEVSVPHQTGHIYLVTNRHGQYRLVILSRPTITGAMHGLLTTLQQGKGSQLTPVSMPVVFERLEDGAPPPAVGAIALEHASHAAYRAALDRTLREQFAVLIG